MFLHIHYPFRKDHVITAVLGRDLSFYWKAADVCKILNYKGVGWVLKRYMQDEKRLRYYDVCHLKAKDTYVLEARQVIKLIASVPQKNNDYQFEHWFKNILSGVQKLHPTSIEKFKELLENPEKNLSVFIQCIFSPDCPHATETDASTNIDDTAPMSIKEELIDITETYCDDSVLNESISSPWPGLNEQQPSTEIDPQFIFTIPELNNVIKEKLLLSVGSMIGCAPSTSRQPTAEEVRERWHESRQQGGQQQQQQQEQPQSNDPFALEVDHTKGFVFTDPLFETEYKFHAIKVNWNTLERSFGIAPFWTVHDNNNTFFYFPVKKH